MELKLKENVKETYIYVPFINGNVIGKFIEEGLYTHLYEIYPDYFEVVVETKKTTIVNDILINDGTEKGSITK